MKVYEAVARALCSYDVRTIFGLIGDANLFLVNAYCKLGFGAYVASAHESGAVLMANGYALASGKVGVATVTHGPGLTNTFTALVESARRRVPLVVIAGDTAVGDVENLQNIAQPDVVEPTGAGFVQASSDETAAEEVIRALTRAKRERRPIVFNLPVDVQLQEYVGRDPMSLVGEPEGRPSRPDQSEVEAAAGVIAGASRPIVLAGRGVVESGAMRSVLRLAHRTGAPVSTTLLAKGLFNDDDFDLGVFGTLSSPVALEAIAHSDCIVAFGASLNRWTTDHGDLLTGRRVVQCDADAGQIGRYTSVDAGVVGELGSIADQIVRLLDIGEIKPTRYRSPLLKKRIAEYAPRDYYEDQSGHGSVDIRTAVLRLDEIVPKKRTVVVDAGRFLTEALKYVHVPGPREYVHTVSFGSIGLGMGNAVGAALARPEQPVLLLSGDGGFMLGGVTEFDTAVRYGIDLIVVVFNDRAYGAEHVQLVNQGQDPSLTMFDRPDLASVAVALGGRGVTVGSAQDLESLGDTVALRGAGPLLIDVRLDPSKVPNHRRH